MFRRHICLNKMGQGSRTKGCLVEDSCSLRCVTRHLHSKLTANAVFRWHTLLIQTGQIVIATSDRIEGSRTHKEGSIVQESSCLQQALWHSLLPVHQDGQHDSCNALQRLCGLILPCKTTAQKCARSISRLRMSMSMSMQMPLALERMACAPCLDWRCLSHSANAQQLPLPAHAIV